MKRLALILASAALLLMAVPAVAHDTGGSDGPKPHKVEQANPGGGGEDSPGDTQGNSPSCPDQDGTGADKGDKEPGCDKPDSTGGDSNNGCGNDPDREDDNNGNCGKPSTTPTPGPTGSPGTTPSPHPSGSPTREPTPNPSQSVTPRPTPSATTPEERPTPSSTPAGPDDSGTPGGLPTTGARIGWFVGMGLTFIILGAILWGLYQLRKRQVGAN